MVLQIQEINVLCEASINEENPFESTFTVSFSVRDFSDLNSLDRYTRGCVVGELIDIAKENLKKVHDVRMSRYNES